VFGLLAAFLLVASLRGNAQGPPQENPFYGKVIAVTIDKTGGGGFMQDARIRQVGNRLFIVGKHTNLGGKKRPEFVMWFPVDEIASMMEFDDVEDAAKAYELDALEKRNLLGQLSSH
jgi:hypothetical protein